MLKKAQASPACPSDKINMQLKMSVSIGGMIMTG